MESKAMGNYNFATKVISAENVEKKCGRSKKKESNLFFPKLLIWAMSLKINLSGKLLCFLKF